MATTTELSGEREAREQEAKAMQERAQRAKDDMVRAQKADFEAKIPTVVLRQAIASVAAILDECRVSVRTRGIDVTAVDPAHVAMVELNLDRQAFESFELDDPFAFVLDVDKFRKDIKHVAEESVVIGFRSNRFYMKAGNIRLRQPDIMSRLEGMSEPKVPNLKLPSTFVVPRAPVMTFLKLDPSDIVRFIASEVGLELWAEGKNEEDIVLAFEKDEMEVHDCKELISSEFPHDYFSNILKTCPAASFRMKVGNDYPVKLSWAIGKADSLSDARFLLAPRITTEDAIPRWKDQWQARHNISAPPAKATDPGTDDGGTPVVHP